MAIKLLHAPGATAGQFYIRTYPVEQWASGTIDWIRGSAAVAAIITMWLLVCRQDAATLLRPASRMLAAGWRRARHYPVHG